MNTIDTTIPSAIRTVLHLSPAVCAVAMSSAQQAGLSLQEWLDHRVSYALADDDVMMDRGLDAVAPWSLATADLFVHVANSAPEVLQGRWALLYERVRLEPSLWHEPSQCVAELEDGAPVSEPYLSLPRVRAAWPRLCASVFCL